MGSMPLLNLMSIRSLTVWRYRSLILNMVERDFRSKYLGSLLGCMWSVIKPAAMIFIYTVIFSKIMRNKLPDVDDVMGYGIFLCSGLLTWNFFSELLERCLNIFPENANLIKKVNFPRITLPVGLFISTTINFSIIFLIFLITSGRNPGWTIIGFIPLLLIQQSFSLALGMLLATLNVFFRDIGHLVTIILQFWFWGTPIVYPRSILPDKFQFIIEANPMTNLITSYQQIVLKGDWPQWYQFRYHIVGALMLLYISYNGYRKLAPEMVDEL